MFVFFHSLIYPKSFRDTKVALMLTFDWRNLTKIKSEISNRDMSERPEMGKINVQEYRRGSKKRPIQRNWQHRVHKTKKKQIKDTTHYVVGHHNTQTNPNNVHKNKGILQQVST